MFLVRRRVVLVRHGRSVTPNIPRAGSMPLLAVVSFLVCCVGYCTFTFPLFDSLTLRPPGIGNIGVGDIALVALIACATHFILTGAQLDAVDKIAVGLAVWFLTAAVAAAALGDMPWRALLQSSVRWAPLWIALPLLRRLPESQFRAILYGTCGIAAFVACLHLYVILNRRDDLVAQLYYWYSGRADDPAFAGTLAALGRGEDLYAGAWPGGGLLLSSVAAGCVAGVAHPSIRSSRGVLTILGVLCYLSMIVIVGRGVCILLTGLLPLLCLLRYGLSKRVCYLLLALVGTFLTAAGVVLIAYPNVWDTSVEKWSRALSDFDVRDRDLQRVQDTTQGIREILASPLFGNGQPKLRHVLSEVGGDVHAFVSVGLAGGIPAVLILLLLYGLSIASAWQKRSVIADIGVIVSLHILALCLMNAEAGFIVPRSLLVSVLALACMTRANQPTPFSRCPLQVPRMPATSS